MSRSKAKSSFSYGCCFKIDSGLLTGFKREDGLIKIAAPYVIRPWSRPTTCSLDALLLRRFGMVSVLLMPLLLILAVDLPPFLDGGKR
jgi:hypothetical protein